MTEEIIANLFYIRALLVISRSSAMAFKGTKKTVPEIARSVNVRHVLEGSVREAGNSLRITARLIDAETDAHLWADKYNGAHDDVFDIHKKVARAIAEEIQLRLAPEEEARIGARGIGNLEAYECYLKARREVYELTKDGLDQALRNLEQGLEIVGDNVLLYSGLGHVYLHYWDSGAWAEVSHLQNAEECPKRMVDLEPDSVHAFLNRGSADLHRPTSGHTALNVSNGNGSNSRLEP
jgi:adenylate cyclase